MLTLAALISARKQDRGWSYNELERRGGHVFTSQRWQQLATGARMKEFPEPATLLAMADALEVGITEVVFAAARTIFGSDIRRHGSALAHLLPNGTDLLTDRMRDAILAIVRAAVAEASEQLRHGEAPDAPDLPRGVFDILPSGGDTRAGRNTPRRAVDPSG